MYFPYLRGKQYELLALRNIATSMPMYRHKFSPIIEPVKKATQPLSRCIKELATASFNFSVIINPSVGEMSNGNLYNIILDAVKEATEGYQNFQLAFLINSEKSWQEIWEIMREVDFEYGGIMLIHNTQFNDIIDRVSSVDTVKYNLINYGKTSRRYHRNFLDKTKVSFDDYFNQKNRNSEYKHVEDETFSDEYKFYSDENFVGFSDFLTLGSSYSDGGFMPYAIAIHITYKGKDDIIRVRHFVSDTNDDEQDVAGKFAEALRKLIDWLGNGYLHTKALDEFNELHINKHFPGLGTIKRLSIENHIELVSKLI